MIELYGVAQYEANPSHEYMGPEQRDFFGQLLKAWRAQVERDIQQHLNVGESRDGHVDAEDVPYFDEVASEAGASLRRDQRLLERIIRTIELHESSTAPAFGYCQDCEDEIGVSRLMVRPIARLCISCKTKQEEQERRASTA